MNGAEFRQREQIWAILARIAKALERIADRMEATWPLEATDGSGCGKSNGES